MTPETAKLSDFSRVSYKELDTCPFAHKLVLKIRENTQEASIDLIAEGECPHIDPSKAEFLNGTPGCEALAPNNGYARCLFANQLKPLPSDDGRKSKLTDIRISKKEVSLH